MHAENNTEYKHIIFHDGTCNLCLRLVNFLILKDKKNLFRFLPNQSCQGQLVLAKYGIQGEQPDTLYYLRNGVPLKKSDAVLYLLKDLGGFYRLLFGFIIVPAPLRDFMYELVAKRRYSIFGRQRSCQMPPSSLTPPPML